MTHPPPSPSSPTGTYSAEKNSTEAHFNSANSTEANAIESVLQQIAQLGQTGRLAEAMAHCQQLLQQHPQTARGWDMLGLITLQQGHPQAALSHLERSIALDPNQSIFYDHAGVAHCSLGNFEQGIICYQRALELSPQTIHIRYNLGLALQKLGRSDEALHTYRQMLEQQPQHAMAHYQIGNLLQLQQQYTAAITHYRQAIQQHPNYTEAWYNLGVALQQTGEQPQALHAYQQALQLKPQYAEALNGLGTLLDKQERLAESLRCYQQALTLQPNYIHALLNLGSLQIRLDRLPEAETTYRQVLQLVPESLPALDNLIKIHLQLCHWTELADLTTQLQTIAQDRIAQGLSCEISPLNSLFLPFSATEQQTIAHSHAQTIARRMGDRGDSNRNQALENREQGTGNFPISPAQLPKIRLGYVSGDFRYHAVGHLIFRLFELHDRQQFQVFAYSLGPDDGSAERQKLVADCDCFRDISQLTPRQAAQQIEQDGIHILIDLAGYTDYACPELFALRPAPIQVNYLGYPGTLGTEAIDYIITDPVIASPELSVCLSERCVYLPDSYQLNSYQQYSDQQYEIADQSPQAIDHQPNPFIFCCFNKSQKIEPQIFAVWMRILSQVPESVLWLLSDRPEAETNLKRSAQAQGIHPDRIVFLPRVLKVEHLTRQAQADLFLDTLFYNAHVTASDALWAGVPVLTVLGETFASRVAASLLTAIGLPELIAPNLEAYERLAVHLATHAEALQQFKTQLVDRRSQFALFDTARTVQHLETGYRLMWQRHQAGQTPEAIWVKPDSILAQGTDHLQQPDQTGALLSSSPAVPIARSLPVLPIASSPSSADRLTCTIDDGFGSWLSQTNGALAITTYQSNKIMLVGWNGQQVTLLPREFTRPMGIAVSGDRLALATHEEVLLFANASTLVPGYLPDRSSALFNQPNQPNQPNDHDYDALYLPRATYATGDLQIHDLAYGSEGLWMVNTRFSCLAQLSSEFSFIPRWQPPFISELNPDDRCHLNGLAMVAGKPKYVTALGKTNTARGWRSTKATGGILIEVETGEICLQGLFMPHSPRWYQERLWLLNSGTGELWQVDPATWQHQVVCTLPGFGRGLCFVGDYALVGLSQIRDPHIFGGLDIQKRFDRLRCGIGVIDLKRGEPVGWLDFTNGCRELYDVAFLPGIRHPALLSSDKAVARQAITTPEFAYWLRPLA